MNTVYLCLVLLAVSLQSMAVEMIADRHFQDGVTALEPISGADEGIIQYKNPYSFTRWRLAQWGSQQTVSDAVPMILPSGSMVWSNSFKHIVMGPIDNTDSELVLAVNAINEYGGVYRQSGESWPHLLVSQNISNPKGWFKEYAPWISDLHEVIVTLDLKLLYANNIYTTGYSSSLHAAQFLLYFTIQNLRLPRDTNPDYGNYLWFGVRFYDDRNPLPGLSVNYDAGTGKLIYNIGIVPFCDSGITTGEWKHVQGDILPYIKAGLQEAWGLGYLTNSFNLDDYKIGGMNIGWEVPGLSDVAMQVRNFSLQAYGTDFARTYEFNQDGDVDGWSLQNLTDVGATGPTNGLWVLNVPGSDPSMTGPAMRLSADRYSSVAIRLANDGNPVGYSVAQLFWKRNGDNDFSDERSVSIPIANGGGWAVYQFNVGANTNWNGEIIQFRFDPVIAGDGHAIGVDYIRPQVASVSPQNAATVGLDISSEHKTLFWESVPYQQYTLQYSTNLAAGVWQTIDDVLFQLSDGSVMQHSPVSTNMSNRMFYRLQITPGP